MRVPSDFKLFCDSEKIAACVKELGSQISSWVGTVREESKQEVIAMPILRGALFFAADLLREISYPVKVVPIRTTAYDCDGHLSEQGVSILTICDDVELQGAPILLIDDICDTGRTLTKLITEFKKIGAREVKTAVCIKRESDTETPLEPDYVAMRYQGSDWFVGYGMDSADLWRSLPAIYTMRATP